jgi:hypothetical protein
MSFASCLAAALLGSSSAATIFKNQFLSQKLNMATTYTAVFLPDLDLTSDSLTTIYIALFLSWPFWIYFQNILFCFIPMKISHMYRMWMGLNFDVFPGFHQIPCYADSYLLQEWTEHSIISISFEYLKSCINFQNWEGVAQTLSLPHPF